jgi:hypothetical protein
MSIVLFANMTTQEKSILQNMGINEDSEGLSSDELDRWEWISSSGSSSSITERMDLMTLSTDCDDWYFCRLKFLNSDGYVYMSDASFAGDTFTLAGIASESTNDALEMLKRIISYEDSRVPSKISIHAPFFVDSNSIISIYRNLNYYIKSPSEFIIEINNCEIIFD